MNYKECNAVAVSLQANFVRLSGVEIVLNERNNIVTGIRYEIY